MTGCFSIINDLHPVFASVDPFARRPVTRTHICFLSLLNECLATDVLSRKSPAVSKDLHAPSVSVDLFARGAAISKDIVIYMKFPT